MHQNRFLSSSGDYGSGGLIKAYKKHLQGLVLFLFFLIVTIKSIIDRD